MLTQSDLKIREKLLLLIILLLHRALITQAVSEFFDQLTEMVPILRGSTELLIQGV